MLYFEILYCSENIGTIAANALDSAMPELYASLEADYCLDDEYESIEEWIVDCEFHPLYL